MHTNGLDNLEPFHNAEILARLAHVFDAAVNALTPDERALRQRTITAGMAPVGIIMRDHYAREVDSETGMPIPYRDPDTGAFMFDWGGQLLVGIDPEILRPGSQPPSASNLCPRSVLVRAWSAGFRGLSAACLKRPTRSPRG